MSLKRVSTSGPRSIFRGHGWCSSLQGRRGPRRGQFASKLLGVLCGAVGRGVSRYISECGYESGTYNASGWVYRAGKGIDGDDMGGFVVPRTVFAPVGCGDFFPRVVKGTRGRKDFHAWSCERFEDPKFVFGVDAALPDGEFIDMISLWVWIIA